METAGWYQAADAVLAAECGGAAILKDWSDASWEWLRAGGMTPAEAVEWQLAGDD